jgi:hypothetical protein
MRNFGSSAALLSARRLDRAYHVRVLKKLGCIELVGMQPRRGAVEHVYRAADWVLRD